VVSLLCTQTRSSASFPHDDGGSGGASTRSCTYCTRGDFPGGRECVPNFLGKVVLFLEQQHQLPPTNFLETLGQVQLPEEVHARIHDLVARKLAGDELGRGAPDALLNTLIEEQLNKWSKPLFDVRSQVGLSQELENVLAHVLTEGEL
jgi:hypothetical protein